MKTEINPGVNALIFTELMHSTHAYSRGIGAYTIANEIRKAGYTCQVIDMFTKFNDDEMKKIITTFIGTETLIVGFSSTFFMYVDEKLDLFQQAQTDGKKTQLAGQQLVTAHYPFHRDRMNQLFDEFRKINPKIKIVLGGSKTNSASGPCDAYAIGFCDTAIVDYMKFLQGKNPFFQYEKVNNTQIMFFGSTDPASFNFSESVFEWHKTDHVHYGETVPIEIARGCIFKCKFCAYPLNGKKKLDHIKNDNILKDAFLKNYYEHGITRYLYTDDTHNDSVEKLERLHKVVTSLPFELEYGAYLRHDLLYAHKHTASLLRESGLRSVVFGIETMNHESAKAIGKGLHPEKIKELLYWLKEDVWKNEVATSSGFIIGLPHDTPDTINEWSKWVLDKACPLDGYQFEPLYILKFLKSSRIYRSEFEMSAEKYGYVLGENGYWKNEHFDFNSAKKVVESILQKTYNTDRCTMGGFSLMMLCNLGFTPTNLIGKSRNEIFALGKKLQPNYVNAYKEKLLKQINYEIPI